MASKVWTRNSNDEKQEQRRARHDGCNQTLKETHHEDQIVRDCIGSAEQRQQE
jgi:hypothetical protein